MNTIIIILTCLIGFVFIVFIYKNFFQLEKGKIDLLFKKERLKELNEAYEQCNKQFIEANKKYEDLNKKIQDVQIKKAAWDEKINSKIKEFNLSEQNSREAFEKYCMRLEQDYENKNKEYIEDIENLQKLYFNTQQDMQKIFNEAKELRKTYMIMGEQQQKQIIDEERLEFYKIHTDAASLHDIKILKQISEQLNNKNLVDKLIWSTFYQKQSKAHFIKILGAAKVICGIYKITNTETNQVYIGQSINILERWIEHIKEGLNVGKNKKSNKLYDSMHKYGIEVFTWELLEECERQYLNKKEKFYIQSFAADVYGLNSTMGNS